MWLNRTGYIGILIVCGTLLSGGHAQTQDDCSAEDLSVPLGEHNGLFVSKADVGWDAGKARLTTTKVFAACYLFVQHGSSIVT